MKKNIHITYILPGLDLPPRTPATKKGLGWNSPTKKVLILVLTLTTTWGGVVDQTSKKNPFPMDTYYDIYCIYKYHILTSFSRFFSAFFFKRNSDHGDSQVD